MGDLMRNKLAVGIVLGLASLTILPATGADKSATTLTQTQYAELLRARDAVWRAWFANDRAALEKILPEDTIASITARRNGNIVLKCWKVRNNSQPMEAS